MELHNILVVDDDMSNLNALKRALRREYNVFLATNGQDALSIMEQNDIDLIIADHRMPGMTGMELLEKILQKHPDIIRIVLTAYADERLFMDAINIVHAHGLISKPWEPEEIKAIAKKWIDQRYNVFYKTECPTFKYLTDGDIKTFWCPYCRRWHNHRHGDGYRTAHCRNQNSPLLLTDYMISPYSKEELKKIKKMCEYMLGD